MSASAAAAATEDGAETGTRTGYGSSIYFPWFMPIEEIKAHLPSRQMYDPVTLIYDLFTTFKVVNLKTKIYCTKKSKVHGKDLSINIPIKYGRFEHGVPHIILNDRQSTQLAARHPGIYGAGKGTLCGRIARETYKNYDTYRIAYHKRIAEHIMQLSEEDTCFTLTVNSKTTDVKLVVPKSTDVHSFSIMSTKDTRKILCVPWFIPSGEFVVDVACLLGGDPVPVPIRLVPVAGGH